MVCMSRGVASAPEVIAHVCERFGRMQVDFFAQCNSPLQNWTGLLPTTNSSQHFTGFSKKCSACSFLVRGSHTPEHPGGYLPEQDNLQMRFGTLCQVIFVSGSGPSVGIANRGHYKTSENTSNHEHPFKWKMFCKITDFNILFGTYAIIYSIMTCREMKTKVVQMMFSSLHCNPSG